MAAHFDFVDIVLADDKERFESGDEVKGVLRLALKGQSILSNVKICLISVAEVDWVENPGTRYHRAGRPYHDKMRIINITYSLPKKYECLSEGQHDIPFTFKLPEKDIPSTFVGPHGSIKYYVEAIVEESGIEDGHRVGLKEFFVDAPIKQNIKLSIGGSNEKELGVLNMGKGKLILWASLSKKGHIPGELIELHVTVDNQSTAAVKPRATLYQTQIYMCGERHKAQELALTEPVEGKEVVANSQFTETLFLPIPPNASLTIKSPIISIKYFIHVTLDIPHAIDIHVNVPIVVVTKSALQ